MALVKGLGPALRAHAQRIEASAREAGLDFYEVVFEALEAREVNAIAAYGGFPVRYPSWRFGMDYERLEKGHQWGFSKIYELVINNDPTVAYLVRTNSDMEQKLVMAHVFGHADFFKHNVWFAPTERRMLDRMAEHGTRLRRLTDRHGQEAVETFLDRALCLDNLIDPFLPMRRHMRRDEPARPAGLAERARLAFEATLSDAPAPVRVAPPAPEGARPPSFDVLGFLEERAPLEPWQKEVLRIVRAEAYYFLPQRMTKIMNEGWASYWHSRLLTGGILGAAEIVDFADCHSGATQSQPGQLNPYKLGIELFRHAERKGMDLFRLRRVHNDATFLDELLDEDFAARQQLFLFGKNTRTGRTEVQGRDFQKVREKLLGELAWGGLPRIELVDADHEGRGELALHHHHDGRDLELAAAGETLKSLARLWGRPAHLTTREDGQPRRLSSDGEGVRSVELAKDADEAEPKEKRSA